MDKVLDFHRGRLPLLVSIPHAGLKLTETVANGLVERARSLPDTDWHIPRLYDFACELGASVLAGEYSRFVIDLNRPADDTPMYVGATTGLFPSILFEGDPLFREGLEPSRDERAGYLQDIWSPYHHTLQIELTRLRDEFGYALLWDAHSIRSVIPHLFDGRLPDFNLGTFNGASCHPTLAAQLQDICARSGGYTSVLNGRFKGGHITRHYGDPANDVHAVQLELTQRNYMNESAPFDYREDLAQPTQAVLQCLLQTMLTWGAAHYMGR